VNAVETRYAAARSLKAAFLQRYSRGPADLTVESGTVYFSRPGRMRWEYESPEEKLFVADGKQAWFFVPADRTATRSKTKESDDWRTPLALLAGRMKRGTFARLCRNVERLSPQAAAESVPHAALRCLPKGDDPPFTELLLDVDSENRLSRVLIREAGGIETEFRFGNWEENLPLPEALFHFRVPPGVAIVDESTLFPRDKP
jgi:outer membrane lipoprotein carrier protein